MEKSARISPCGKYRTELKRVWERRLGLVNFIMLNPSTADAENDDPTIRKCIKYAKSWGYGGIVITNLFDYRSPSPKELKKEPFPMSGGGCDYILMKTAKASELAVCAWGNHGDHMRRDRTVTLDLKANGIECFALKINDTGQPAHPLYLSGSIGEGDLISFYDND